MLARYSTSSFIYLFIFFLSSKILLRWRCFSTVRMSITKACVLCEDSFFIYLIYIGLTARYPQPCTTPPNGIVSWSSALTFFRGTLIVWLEIESYLRGQTWISKGWMPVHFSRRGLCLSIDTMIPHNLLKTMPSSCPCPRVHVSIVHSIAAWLNARPKMQLKELVLLFFFPLKV